MIIQLQLYCINSGKEDFLFSFNKCTYPIFCRILIVYQMT